MEKTETQKKVKETGLEVLIRTELKRFELSDAFFKKMKSKFSKLSVEDASDKQGYNDIREALSVARSTKSSIESKRKLIKEESLKFGRAVDFEAKRLQEMLLPITDELKNKKLIVDQAIEKAKEEKRIAKEKIIQDRAILLMEIGMFFNGISYDFEELTISSAQLSVYDDVNFNSFIESAKEKIKVANEAKLIIERKEKLIAEREEKLEKYANFIEVDENKSVADMSTDEFNAYLADLINLSIEHERKEEKAKEDKRKDEILREKRMKIISPVLKYQNEYINIETIADWTDEDFNDTVNELLTQKGIALEEEKILQEEKKKLAAERIKFEKQQQDEINKKNLAKERKEKAALKPDKEKLLLFAEELKEYKYPKVKSELATRIINHVNNEFLELAEYIDEILK